MQQARLPTIVGELGGLDRLSWVVTSYLLTSTIVVPLYGMFGGVFGLATVVGPLLGGFLVENLSWRWIFYINLPLGTVALAVISAVFSHGLNARLDKVLTPGVTLPQPLTPDAIHHLPPVLHAQYLDAFAGALHTVYFLAACVVVFSFALAWLLQDIPLRKQP